MDIAKYIKNKPDYTPLGFVGSNLIKLMNSSIFASMIVIMYNKYNLEEEISSSRE
jgi:hypothetical protein